MKVTFVQRDVYDYFGLMQLIAVLEPAGHVCDVIVDFSDNAIMRRLRAAPPGLAALPCIAGVSYSDATRLCARIKAEIPGTETIIGGSYATLYSEIFNSPGIDFMCVGEGDEAVVELANALDAGAPAAGILNIWSRDNNGNIIRNELRNLVENLDSLPLPERRHHYKHACLRDQKRKNFLVGRGCPFNCSYCYVSSMRKIYAGKGTFVRMRSPGHALDELVKVKKEYGMGYVGFMDDTFPTDPEWLGPFSEGYRQKIGLPFIAAARAEALNEERLKLLADAGCDILGVGIETANEGLRDGVLERRGGDNQQLIATLKSARKHGMRLLTFNMLGIPGETIEDGWRTVAVNAEVGAELPRFTLLTPSPGLKIAETAEQMSLCTEADIRGTSTYLKKSVFKQEGIGDLVRLQKVAFAAARYPGMNFLWKFLAKRAPAFVLDGIYLLTNGLMFLDINKWSVWFTIKYGRTVSRWYD